jgi:LmbE family N-acetylglucosaminyl deacetylase
MRLRSHSNLSALTHKFDAVPAHLKSAITAKANCLFLSPHLDDAVLSCGALMTALADHCSLTVVTIFTAAGPSPHTRAARSFMRQCSATDAAILFSARRAEDREVLKGLGVSHLHLGIADALYRRRELGSLATRHLGRLLPELVHRYPTYRFDIAKGRVASGDRPLIDDLITQMSDLIKNTSSQVLFCPLGVGRHVDHLITRIIGQQYPQQVIYYSDFPYNQSSTADSDFIEKNKLKTWVWNRMIPEKMPLIQGYKTQAAALFPTAQIPHAPEIYYIAAS